MAKNKTFHKKKTLVVFLGCMLMLTVLIGRLVNLMVVQSEYYAKKADDLHERERKIKAARGRILDANGVVLADNKTVCTISVIHSQIKEPEKVIAMLTKELGIDEAQVRKRVNKISSIERVKTNVEKEVGDKIREYQFAGVKVDEDFRRFYPYGGLASRVLGFTGGDNQGIIGLEVKYEEVLKGINGTILTTTDARGIEQNGIGEKRKEPVEGFDLCISLDYNMQMYAQQEAERVMEQKEAEKVSVLLLNPQNGEIYACVNVPEFDLNDPYTLPESVTVSDRKERTDALNRMWRNTCINDTYEPGSTFKIITASAGLEAGVVTLQDQLFLSWLSGGGRSADSLCIEEPDMEHRLLYRELKIPVIRFLLMWHYGWVWKNITIIFKNSVYWKKQVLICRGKREPLCIKKKISDRWNWQLSHSVSHSRLLLCSWQRQPPL